MARGFVCEVDGAYRSACAGLDVYGEYEDKHYCVLHFPGEDKEDDFEKVKESKLAQRDYDFGGTVFPEGTSDFSDDIFNGEASFRKATFKGKADFEGAIFKGEASFRKATFKREADFEGAIFKGEASFREATFKEKGDFAKANFAKRAGFRNVTFEKQANFIETIFDQEARFRRTVFQGFVEFKGPSITGPSNEDPCETHTFNKRANFSAAKFEERAVFLGRCTFDTTQEEATFRNALIEKPENFSFDRVWLRPSWFIDTNVQQLRFTNVQWRGFRGGPPGSIVEEIKAIDARRNRRRSKEEEEEEDSQSGYLFDVLAKTCRELSTNAESNHEYPLANEFHYWSMDALRIGSWNRFRNLTLRGLTKKETWRDIGEHIGLITTLYWALSGYGVRATRAFWVLVAMWTAFTTLYVLVYPSEFKDFGQGIDYLLRVAVYSLLALVRLNPRPIPDEPGLFQFLVGLEGILGPLQIALLALAIRRKVMR